MSGQIIRCTVEYCRYNEHRFCALDTIQISTQPPTMADGEETVLPSTFCASFESKEGS